VRSRRLVAPGAFELALESHTDRRGEFVEWFKAAEFRTALGHPLAVAQANLSVSARGVLRGIHYTAVPPGQGKLVICVAGRVVDAVVDLRVGSPAFGSAELIPLDARERHAVWIPEGLGHAFLALEDDSIVSYLCTAEYDPSRERAVHPLDPTLAIPWPNRPDRTTAPEPAPEPDDGDASGFGWPILSERDSQAPTLHESQAAGMLPNFAPI